MFTVLVGKNKVAALLACHSRSPKSAPKRPLFSEVLKHQLTAAKRRQSAAPAANPVVALPRRPKQKMFQPSLVSYSCSFLLAFDSLKQSFLDSGRGRKAKLTRF